MDNPNPTDYIRQSYIDLYCKQDEEDVQTLLLDSITYLDKNNEYNFMNELSALIMKCFSLYPTKFIPCLNTIFENPKKNSNYIIITAMLISYLTYNFPDFLPQNSKSFIDEALNEILSENHDPDDTDIFVFQIKIPHEFKSTLISDLILSTKITENLLMNFSDYIPIIFKKISKYSTISNENLVNFVIYLQKDNFKEIFPRIEDILAKSGNLDSTFIINVLKKCQEYDLKIKSAGRLFNFISVSDLTPEICEYLKKLNFSIPDEISPNFFDLSDHELLFKIIKEITILPKDILNEGLLNSNDIQFYHRFFIENEYDKSNEILISSEFLQHFYSIGLQLNFDDKFFEPFISFIQNEKFIEIIDKLIFEICNPSDEKFTDFLIKLVRLLPENYSQMFNSSENITKIILNFVNHKVIPNYKFMKLFENAEINHGLLLMKEEFKLNPYMLYIYLYTDTLKEEIQKIINGEEEEEEKEIQIIEPADFSDENLINFIKTVDLNLIPNLNEDSFSFVISTLLFANCDIKVNFNDLTKKSIVPFYMILYNLLIHREYIDCILRGAYFSSKFELTSELLELFEEGFIYLKENDISFLNAFFKTLVFNITNFSSMLDGIYEFKAKIFDLLEVKFLENKTNINENLIFYESKYYKIYYDFIVKQLPYDPQLKINENEIDDLLSSILAADKLEINDKPIHALIEKMMKDDSNLMHYLKASFESFRDKKELNAKDLLGSCFLYYSIYPSESINTLSHFVIYSAFHDKFIHKARYENHHLPLSTDSLLIISKLFETIKKEPDNFNSFLVLKNIASTFPFLFDQNSHEIFKSTLPALDNYSIIFDNKIDDDDDFRIRKLKASISAYSFLLTSLNSNKVMDDFINWFFTETSTFSCSQLFCFISIFQSILETEIINQFLMSYFIKFNFLDVISMSFNKNIQNKEFELQYIKLLFIVLKYYFELAGKFNSIDTISIFEISKLENIFQTKFEGLYTIFPCAINSNQRNFTKNKEILSFIENVERMKLFWIHPELKTIDNVIMNEHIVGFNNEYAKRKLEVNGIKRVDVYAIDYVDSAQFCSTKPYWISQWYLKKDVFYLSNSHILILNEIQRQLRLLQHQKLIRVFNKDACYENAFKNTTLYETLIKRMLSSSLLSCEDIDSIFEMLFKNKFLSNQTFIDSIVKVFNQYDHITVQLFDLIVAFLNKEINYLKKSDDSDSDVKINVDFMEKFIEICLQPQFRDENTLKNISHIISCFELNSVPNNFSHFVGFLITNRTTENIFNALELCSKFKFKETDNFTIFIEIFDDEMDKENPSLNLISKMMDSLPSIASRRKKDIIELLSNYTENPRDDPTIINFICSSLNFLTPPRITSQTISFSDSRYSIKRNDSTTYIPEIVWNSSPDFWFYFTNNITKIRDIMTKFELTYSNLKVFNEYPELIPFNDRFEKIQKELKNKLISHTLGLTINAKDIFMTSFNSLFFESDESVWLSVFHIKYVGSIGDDMGGLTKDWLTKLTNEFVNPDLNLFISTSKNLCFQPNPISKYRIENYENYYKFMGKIVARSIIQGVCINVHFTRSFLKQILHREVGFNELESVDEVKYNSLRFFIDNNIDEIDGFEAYFEVDRNEDGKVTTVELIENGSKIKVTDGNKLEYVKLMSKYYLIDSIQNQVTSFCEGFDSLIPHELLKPFNSNELNLIICGIPDFNVDDLIACIKYTDENNFRKFASCISKWNKKDLALLLLFITGTSQVPTTGFKYFEQIGKPIKIQSTNNTDKYPVAHTCFNELDLPRYESEEIMDRKLKYAINECDSFEIV